MCFLLFSISCAVDIVSNGDSLSEAEGDAQTRSFASVEDAQAEVDFPLLSLPDTEYTLFGIQVIEGIEPGNEHTQRVMLFYEDDESVVLIAQEPVSPLVDPRDERIKDEATEFEDLQVRNASAVLVPVEQAGCTLYWNENGISMEIFGAAEEKEMVQLAEALR